MKRMSAGCSQRDRLTFHTGQLRFPSSEEAEEEMMMKERLVDHQQDGDNAGYVIFATVLVNEHGGVQQVDVKVLVKSCGGPP